jgi:hypothetical protein
MAEESSAPSSSAQQPPENHKHGPVPEGLECMVTMEDIDETNYVEYQCRPSGIWRSANIEESVVRQLLKSQFHTYIARVKTTDCQAELKRLLTAGPPVYISDPHGLPIISSSSEDVVMVDDVTADSHIGALWYASTDTVVSAVLDGAVQGEEREVLWAELKQFVIVDGKEAGDDDDDEKK